MSIEFELPYDHLALSEAENPFPEANALRDTCPVAHTENHGGFWVLSRFEDVCAVARDTQRFTSEKGITIPHHGYPIALPPIELDPPLHKIFRQPLTERFSKATVARSEGEIRGTVTALIDGFIERGHADFAQELTIPFPAHYAVRLLGLPVEDIDRFADWAVRIMTVKRDETVVMETFAYFNAVYEDRLANRREDIPSLLLEIEVDGRPISDVEFCATMSVLFTAGLDTTANGGALVLELLAKDEQLRAYLSEDLESRPAATVDELLRFVTPLPALSRTTKEPVTIRGHTIPAGERVQLNWMAANRDPEQFPNPDELDYERNAKSQVAFGHGIHRCLGQHIARAEITVLIQEVLKRMPDFALDPQKPIERYSGVTRGILSMPVVFTPGETSSG